jgi:hypothetical protein
MHRPRLYSLQAGPGSSKPRGLPVVQSDVLERRGLHLGFMATRGEECVEIGLLDPDAAAPALAAEAVMLEQPLRAPFVYERIRHADARGNLLRSEHIPTYLSMPESLDLGLPGCFR